MQRLRGPDKEEKSTWRFAIGKNAVLGAFAVAALAAAAYMLWPDGASTTESEVNTQTYIDVDGNAFQHKLTLGEMEVTSPYGKKAFRAEMCYWTKDGKTKTDGTPVLLRSDLGEAGPTFCPDCGRLVRPLNPPPVPGLPDSQQRPPPTKSEYESRARVDSGPRENAH